MMGYDIFLFMIFICVVENWALEAFDGGLPKACGPSAIRSGGRQLLPPSNCERTRKVASKRTSAAQTQRCTPPAFRITLSLLFTQAARLWADDRRVNHRLLHVRAPAVALADTRTHGKTDTRTGERREGEPQAATASG